MNSGASFLIDLSAVDVREQLRHMTVIFRNQDSWFSDSGVTSHDVLLSHLIKLVQSDKNVIASHSSKYKIENGIYTPDSGTWPTLSR